jgi:hypothetical protein
VSLRDLQKRHMRQILGNANGVAEPVTYRFASGAADRTFNAVVRRVPGDGGDAAVNRRTCQVVIPRADDVGVESVVVGKDKILVAVRIGEAASELRVIRVLSEAPSHIYVEVSE